MPCIFNGSACTRHAEKVFMEIFSLVVSICIPTYNSETWIKNTLENIENISYDKNNLELLFVDGKSIDGTVDILENFKEKNLHKYKEIKIIVQSCNIPEARNICIKESCGEYLLFVDSDIMLSKNSVRRLTNHMKTTSIASIYYQRCRPDPPKKNSRERGICWYGMHNDEKTCFSGSWYV